MHVALLLLIVCWLSTLTVPVFATEKEGGPPSETVTVQKRYLDYRPQLAGADALALGVLMSAVAWENGPQEELAWMGLGVYVLGAPTVHWAHAQPWRGLTSVVMRAGFPVVGASLGLLIAATCNDEPADPDFSDERGWECLGVALGLAAFGAVGGAVTAIIVDDGFLGKVPIDERQKATRTSTGGLRVTLVPLAEPKHRTMGMSLVAGF